MLSPSHLHTSDSDSESAHNHNHNSNNTNNNSNSNNNDHQLGIETDQSESRINSEEPFPIRQVILVLLTVLPEIVIHHMMTPLFPFIARSFLKKHPEQDSKDIGYYTGLLHSTYFLPSIVINPLMGYLSDRYGRRPILLIGLCGYGMGTLLLGLSSTYIFALVSLFITGCFSGNTVVAKGMLGDLAKDESSRAKGYAAYGIVFGGAGIFGTALGGVLADPALFANSPFLSERPYLIACLVGFSLAVLGILATLLLLKEADSAGSATRVNNYSNTTLTNLDGSLKAPRDNSTTYLHPIPETAETHHTNENRKKGGLTKSFSASSAIEFEIPRSSIDASRQLLNKKPQPSLQLTSQETQSDRRQNSRHVVDRLGVPYNQQHASYINISRRSSQDDMIPLVQNSAPQPISSASPSLTYSPSHTREPTFSSSAPSITSTSTSSSSYMIPSAKPALFSYFASMRLLPSSTIIPICLYGLYAFVNSLLHTTIPLLLSSPASEGGYNFNSALTSLAMTFSGVGKFIVKISFVPLYSLLGLHGAFILGIGVSVPCIVVLPLLYGVGSGLQGSSRLWVVAPVLAVAGFGEGATYLAIIMFLTNSVDPGSESSRPFRAVSSRESNTRDDPDDSDDMPTPSSKMNLLGSVHGVGGMFSSIARTVGPTFGGTLWARLPVASVFWGIAGVLVVEGMMSFVTL